MVVSKDRGYDFTRTGPTVMHVWYLLRKEEAVTGLGLSWDRAGPEEPEEKAAWLGCRLPSSRHSPLASGEGGLGWGWKGGTLSVSNAGLLRTPTLPMRPDPNPALPPVL